MILVDVGGKLNEFIKKIHIEELRTIETLFNFENGVKKDLW